MQALERHTSSPTRRHLSGDDVTLEAAVGDGVGGGGGGGSGKEERRARKSSGEGGGGGSKGERRPRKSSGEGPDDWRHSATEIAKGASSTPNASSMPLSNVERA